MREDALAYYQILGVSRNADAALIKRSYRDLAKQWHPDHNTSDEALEKFQQLSSAYEVLENEDSRLNYDLLSMVYGGKDYPDLENIRAYEDGNPDIRALCLQKVRGLVWKYKAVNELKICGWKQAIRLQGQSAAANWLLGWWNPAAALRNIKALLANWRTPVSQAESLRVLVHNTIAYQQGNKPELAVASAVRALDYADAAGRALLQKYIQAKGMRVSRPKVWSLATLKAVQLIVPMLIVLAAIVPVGTHYVSEGELWRWFSKKQEIDYYQEVNFGERGRSVDDVVVGKILNIPVDKSDVSRLYHLKAQTKIMYGPGDDFDVLKDLPSDTTVRLTGQSPDNVWARVMIDNGEMGFVRAESLKQGIGKEIPYASKISQP